MSSGLKVLVINRDQDVGRWNFVSRNLERFENASIERVSAVDGHAENYSVVNSVPSGWTTRLKTPTVKTRRAVSACFLSHAKAWALVAASEAPYCLIVEDDTDFDPCLDTLPRSLEAAPEFELMFVNNRMVDYRGVLPNMSQLPDYITVDAFYRIAAEVLPHGKFERRQADSQGLLKTAPGSDGYVVTPMGAHKLLTMLSDLKRLLHVDDFLYMSGVNRNTMQHATQNPKWAQRQAEAINASHARLNSYIANQTYVFHEGRRIGGTVIHTDTSKASKTRRNQPVRFIGRVV